MAVIKVAKGGKSIKQAIDYVQKKSELTSGKDCSDKSDQAREQMEMTKELWSKTEGRQYKHYIQSFSPGEVTPEKAHEIGKEFAEQFKGYEVFIATHTDRNHIHNHFIVNSVNFENGKKFHKDKKFLEELKKQNDKICEREKLSIPEKKFDKEIRSFNQNKYQLFKRLEEGHKVKSYILDTAIAVEKSASNSRNKDEFINEMQKKGYSVDWNDNKKHITFKNSEGKKVRASNLEKTFNEPKFSKEGLLNELSRPKEQRTISKRTTSRIEPSKQNGIRELTSKGTPNRVLRTIRGITDSTRAYSIKGRKELSENDRQQRAIERKSKSHTYERSR